MLEHLKELSSLYGVSGNEDAVRNYIINQIDGKCEYHTDNLGNIIAFKKGKKPSPKKLMIAAHMDEVGMIVTGINSDGTLSFDTVGGVNDDVVAGRRVVLYNKNLNGVIGAKAVHNMSSAERKEKLNVSHMFIDIGANSAEDVKKIISPGEYAAFCAGYIQLGGGKICSKALDDRAGCAIMIDLINKESEYDIYYAFTVQEELGLRGAAAAAYAVNPDFAIVLETTTASDIAGSEGNKRVCVLGDGPVISFMDRRTVYDRELYSLAFKTAAENNIPCQTKTMIAGGNDSGVIHISRNGVRTLAVSAPCRYLHSPSCTAKYSDIEQCETLTELLVSRILEL